MKHKTNLLLLLPLLLLLGEKGNSQPFTLDPAIKPVELVLKNVNPSNLPKAKGRMNVSEVTQNEDTAYYFVQGASIYSPVYVGLKLQDAANPVTISLHKMNWQNENRSGTTNDKGSWSEQFKTENDFGIRVVASSKPSTYSLVVWVGDEPKMELPTVFSNESSQKSETGKTSGGFLKNNLLYIIIGVMAIAIIVLFFMLKKRKK
jgi:hypothetical protein